MPKRPLIGSIIFTLVLVLVFQIVNLRVLADHEPISGPITPPITSEVTNTPTPTVTVTPIPTRTPTPTITSTPTVTPQPAGEATLSGKVMYKQLGKISGGTGRLTPAVGVEVQVEGFFDDDKQYQDTTDANGNYAIDLPAGLWKVQVDDDEDAFFVPVFKVVRTNQTDKIANFQGLVFP